MTGDLLTLGIVQCALGGSREENVARVEGLVREAAGRRREPDRRGDGQLFYGSSFVAGTDGSFLAELGRDETGVRVVTLDLAAIRREQGVLGLLPRPASRAIGALLTADGRT